MAEDFSSGDTGSVGDVGGAAQEPAGTSAGSQSANLGSTEQAWTIKWNGREEKVPHSQALEYAQKGYDYTRKMQDLARQREEFNSTRQRYDQAFNEVKSFLQDPAKVEQYYRKLVGQTAQATAQAQQTGDHQDVVTAQLLQQKLQEAKQEIAGFVEQQTQTFRQQLGTEQLAGQFKNELDSHIGHLKKTLPELRVIPRIDQILRDDVRAMGPQTIQEAKAFMVDVAKQHQKSIQQFLLESRKDAGAQGGTNPLKNGIEPAGGAPPLPTQPAEKYQGGIKNPAFKQSIIAELTALAQKDK